MEENNLVTVAIHTYEKAQMLKSLLEVNGIDAFIVNVNQIQPMVSAGVRVKIRESDLPRAISIIEDLQNEIAVQSALEEEAAPKMVLIPVDFSAYSLKACEFGFRLAESMNGEVVLLHAYFAPSFNAMPLGETLSYDGVSGDETLSKVLDTVHNSVEKMKEEIEARIAKGWLPKINYKHVLREGVPEEQILRYAKRHNPVAIVMGTRGQDKKDLDLIGSVTAEIIERSNVPVLAIPENAEFTGFEHFNHIAYATNFDDKDLIAFDKMMRLLKPFKFNIHFVHFNQNNDAWSEIKLSGIKEYFAKYYPNQNVSYNILQGKDMLSAIDKFVEENKIDMIALTTHRRNIFMRLFNPSVARKMVFHSNTSMLVFHS